MTAPIPFAPMPFPLLDDDADGVLPQQDTAAIAAANYALINPYFARNPYRVSTLRAVQSSSGLFNPSPLDGAWHAFSGSQWPSMTFTLPSRIAALVVTISGEIYALTDGALAYTSFLLSGAGLPGGNDRNSAALMAGSGHAYGSRTSVFFTPDTALQAGKALTLTPYWLGSGSGNHGYNNGRLEVVCFHGGAQP